MSETDSFIQEVSEEVRQDRMFALWKKWGPYVIGAIALIVGAAAYWSWQQDADRAAAEARGELLLNLDTEKPEDVAALPGKIDGPAKLIAELTAAAAQAEAGETEAAAKTYAEIAGRADLPVEYRDLAVMQAVRLGADSIDADAEIAQIADGTGPYRLLGKELRAARAAAAGNLEAAHKEMNEILADPGVTAGLQQRIVALLLATGGEISLPETGDG